VPHTFGQTQTASSSKTKKKNHKGGKFAFAGHSKRRLCFCAYIRIGIRSRMKSQWAIGGLKTKGKCKLIPAFSNRTANGQSNKLCQLEWLLIGLFNPPSDLIIHFHFQISSGGLFFIIATEGRARKPWSNDRPVSVSRFTILFGHKSISQVLDLRAAYYRWLAGLFCNRRL